MGLGEAALWGLSGGLAVGTLSLMTAITTNGFSRLWTRGGAGPRLFVFAGTLLLGVLVAMACHDQMSGPWPAFAIGAGAPATVRGLLAGVEATPRPRTRPRSPALPAQEPAPSTSAEGDTNENAS